MARSECPFQEATLFLEPSQYLYSPPAHSCLLPSAPFPREERKVLPKKSSFLLLAGMAPEWELGMGMDIGFGTGGYTSPVATTTTPPAYLYGLPSTDTLRIDDLLDFSNHDLFPTAASVTDAHLVLQPEPSSAAGSAPYLTGDADSSSSSHHYYHHHHYPQLNSLPDDLFVPSEEAAELEWLSKFVDDSFSDVPYSSTFELLAPSINTNTSVEHSVPGRGARSKRSRNNTGAAGAMNHQNTAWSSLTPLSQSSSSTTSSSSSSEFPSSMLKPSNNDNHNNSSSASSSGSTSNKGKKMTGDGVGVGIEGGVRRCTHCASEKTPQWRTGPLGPKTLCNACGVRYKSGRLVPEYRPAASPTFVLTQHSNSHRKVLELRRQKELLLLNPPSAAPTAASATASAARPELLFPNYEVC